MDKDAYLLELSRYVVLNPVRAGMVDTPAQWPWSSYRAIAEHFNVHLATVGRIVRTAMQRCENLVSLREKSSRKSSTTYTCLVNLIEQDERLSVTKTEYSIIQPNGVVSKKVTDVDVGVPGVVSFVHLTTKHQPPQQIQFRKVSRRFDAVNGRLFPLDKKNSSI